MALQKSKTLNNGFVADYYKLVEFCVNPETGIVNAFFLLYKDSLSTDQQPVFRKSINCGNCIPGLIASIVTAVQNEAVKSVLDSKGNETNDLAGATVV